MAPRTFFEQSSPLARRELLRTAAVGTVLSVLGGSYVLAGDDPRTSQKRPDGRIRLPPGQRLISALKPMGGEQGDPSPSNFKLRVHGEVGAPFELDFQGLLALPQTEMALDVHCVTSWSAFDVVWTGVRVALLADKAKVKPEARHVIFEAAHGYTANVPLAEALAPNVLVAHKIYGKPLARAHGAPVRGVVPDLYFWKSAKWLTGIRFVARDQPGYWETRGYHNHGDPWLEERYG
ncbi:MAG: molybdopterin-dependent oxidoreductase [Myxococcales bacterium]|nr:molybdopterin-dependent oxidoreductase [Polyangiaceae bacterium]MDW8247881.1 molybdopterin-dependent oxidoreductase [Myxococcales bacterium]